MSGLRWQNFSPHPGTFLSIFTEFPIAVDLIVSVRHWILNYALFVCNAFLIMGKISVIFVFYYFLSVHRQNSENFYFFALFVIFFSLLKKVVSTNWIFYLIWLGLFSFLYKVNGFSLQSPRVFCLLIWKSSVFFLWHCYIELF